MNMGGNFLASLAACFRVTGGTGASTVARGGVSARTAAGIYTLTLDIALDAINYVPDVTLLTTLIDNMIYADTSDTVKTITTQVIGVDTDSDFAALFWRIAV